MDTLSEIATPADLRCLGTDGLDTLACEIRTHLVESVARSGGHLGSNLGAVELTLALHRAFESPSDTIVWDTGHQAYVHKMVTGRTDDFAGLRKRGGISGYPARSESDHDAIENSHASTALSYAAGLAAARRHTRTNRSQRRVVAVIGDGALTGGLAYEAINNIASHRLDVTIVVNDNGRSYAPTVGGFALNPEAFAAFGLDYTGPLDGHDMHALEDALRAASALAGPKVVHVKTIKGLGYGPAERDLDDHMHGVGPFEVATGTAPVVPSSASVTVPASTPRSWTSVFEDALVDEARKRPGVVAITAAMPLSTGLGAFAREFPERTYDVGIAEQHAATFAAGLALDGMRPVVAIYATFMSRALDQVLMDVALHGLPVTFVLDRAGVTGSDGASHHGILDIAFFRQIPGLVMAAPSDDAELRTLLGQALDHDGPFMLRLPKGSAPASTAPVAASLPPGTWDIETAPGGIALLAIGNMVPVAHKASVLLDEAGIPSAVTNARYVKPLDTRLASLAGEHRLVATIEDHERQGGFGSAVVEALSDACVSTPVSRHAMPECFLEHGSVAELHDNAGLTAESIAHELIERWRQ